MNRIAVVAAAVVIAAGAAGLAFPKAGAAEIGSAAPYTSDSSRADDSSQAVHEWSESEEEAAARALNISFAPVLIFNDGSEEKIDLPFECTLEKEKTSYSAIYSITLTHDETEKLLSDMGRKFEDLQCFDYQVTVKNGDTTDYSEEYMLDAAFEGSCIAHHAGSSIIPIFGAEQYMQGINTTKTYNGTSLFQEDYDTLEINFRVVYSGAKVYKPTEAHKKAMMVDFKPKVALALNDGSEIMTDIKLYKDIVEPEKYYYMTIVPVGDIEKILTDAGKTADDLKGFVSYFDSTYPEGQGITDKSKITNIDYETSFFSYLSSEYQWAEIMPENTTYTENMTIPAKCENLEIRISDGMNGKVCKITGSQDEAEDLALKHIDSIELIVYIDMHNAEIESDEEPEDSSSKTEDSSSKTEDTSSQTDNDSSGIDDSSSRIDEDPDSSQAEQQEVKKGDINGDNTVNVSDIALTAAHVKGIKPLTEEQKKYADLNGDGRIDVSDIVILAKTVKGQK